MTDIREQIDAPIRRLGLSAVAARAGIRHPTLSQWLAGRDAALAAASVKRVIAAAIELADERREELGDVRRVLNAALKRHVPASRT